MFCVWLLLLSIMLSRVLHVVARMVRHSFLWLDNVPSYRHITVYLLIGGRPLGCFHLLWMMLLWTFVCKLLWTYVLLLLGTYLRNTGSCGNCLTNGDGREFPVSPHSLQYLCYWFSDNSHPSGLRWYLTVVCLAFPWWLMIWSSFYVLFGHF